MVHIGHLLDWNIQGLLCRSHSHPTHFHLHCSCMASLRPPWQACTAVEKAPLKGPRWNAELAGLKGLGTQEASSNPYLVIPLGDEVVYGAGLANELKHTLVKACEVGVSLAGRRFLCSCGGGSAHA